MDPRTGRLGRKEEMNIGRKRMREERGREFSMRDAKPSSQGVAGPESLGNPLARRTPPTFADLQSATGKRRAVIHVRTLRLHFAESLRGDSPFSSEFHLQLLSAISALLEKSFYYLRCHTLLLLRSLTTQVLLLLESFLLMSSH